MVKTMRQITFLVVLAVSIMAAQITFAGPSGFAGDSISVVRTNAATNLVITNPVIGDNLVSNYQTIGAPGDTVICGDFGGNGVDGVGVVRDASAQNSLLWIGNWTGRNTNGLNAGVGTQTQDYILFGDQDSDTPLMMDIDPNSPGDELVVVRQDETTGQLLWIWRTPSSETTDSRNFGPNSGIPAPGNYDTDMSNGDEYGVTYDVPVGKAWLLEGEGTGNETITFGAITDQKYQYTWNGVTVPGVTRKSGPTNRVFINDTALTGAPSPTTATIGNETDTVLANCDIHYSNCEGPGCAPSN